MSEYQLMWSGMILRVEDNTYIPPDPENADYQRYQRWLDEGGVPDEAVPPPIADD